MVLISQRSVENKSKFVVETFSTDIDHSSQNLAEESDFRNRYMQELMKKRQQGINNYYGIDELVGGKKETSEPTTNEDTRSSRRANKA